MFGKSGKVSKINCVTVVKIRSLTPIRRCARIVKPIKAEYCKIKEINTAITPEIRAIDRQNLPCTVSWVAP